jgi:hypothetical protein
MWLRIALAGSVLTPILHLLVLAVNGQDPVTTPVSELSRHRWAGLQTFALTMFGFAHLSLAVAMGGRDHGRFWPVARALLIASGAGLVYVAIHFATASGDTLRSPAANDPLWVVACLTGLAMGALQPGLARQSRGLGLFSTVCLGAWLWLVPVIFWVDAGWVGAYERMVGSVYVLWMVGVSYGLIVATPPRAANQAT